MFASHKLGRLFGIDIYVHGTFWLLPALVIFTGLAAEEPVNISFNLALLFGIFACVGLHELGHALAASWYGIKTRDITFYPIGGMARLENMPKKPLPEIVVALAGPAVNLALASVIAIGMVAGIVPIPRLSGEIIEASALAMFATRMLEANLILLGFNLLPVFPMDGGRVLRAVLQLFTDRLTATEAAANVGALFAALMFIVGIMVPGLFMLSILSIFVFLVGRAELAGVRYELQQRRRSAHWATGSWTNLPRPPRVEVAEPADGWVWDAERREWLEYRNHQVVRRWSQE